MKKSQSTVVAVHIEAYVPVAALCYLGPFGNESFFTCDIVVGNTKSKKRSFSISEAKITKLSKWVSPICSYDFPISSQRVSSPFAFWPLEDRQHHCHTALVHASLTNGIHSSGVVPGEASGLSLLVLWEDEINVEKKTT